MEYKISVIIPKVRENTPIRRTINNALRQTVGDFEIIIADVQADYEETLSQYTEENENISLCETLSQAVSLSSGEYIIFMRDDSVLAFSAFRQLLDNAENNDSDVVVCKCAQKNDKGDFVEIKQNFLAEEETELKLLYLANIYSCMFNKKFLTSAVGDIDLDSAGGELEILIKCAVIAKSIKFLPNILVYFTRQEFDKNSSEDVIERLQIFCELTGFLIKNELNHINYKLFLEYIKPVITDFETDKYDDCKNIFLWIRKYFIIISENEDIRRFVSTVLPRREKFILETSVDLFSCQKPSELYVLSLKSDETESYFSALIEIYENQTKRQDEIAKTAKDTEKMISDKLQKMQNELTAVSKKVEALNNISIRQAAPAIEPNPTEYFLYKCRSGQIGMKTIIKGIFAWFKFKFTRRGKNG